MKNLFLTAPLISLQLPFQRRSTSSLKFQNQKDDNEESDVSCQLKERQFPLRTTECTQTWFVYFAF